MSKQRPLPNVLTEAQAAAIMAVPNVASITGLRLRCIMETMYRGGLRVSEVCALTPADVDLNQNILRVLNSKRGKSRLVPIDPRLLPWLQRWLFARPVDGVAFFATVRGGEVVEPQRIRLWKAIRGAAEKAAVKHPELAIDPQQVGCHTLRHSAATEMLRGSKSLLMVRDFLGHASISTTQIYTHLNLDDMREYMEKAAASR